MIDSNIINNAGMVYQTTNFSKKGVAFGREGMLLLVSLE